MSDTTQPALEGPEPATDVPWRPDELDRAIEAIVLVADEPVSPQLLAQLLEIGPGEVERRCAVLADVYERGQRGFVLVRVAGGYRYQTHVDLAPYLERFALEGQAARLSAAALETLAIVAYKQPVSRAQIALIRGVNVDGVLRTLVQRGYVTEVGTDPGPGQAMLFGTTSRFLEHLGLDSVAQLPPLADFVPGPEVVEVLEAGLGVGGDDEPGPRAPGSGGAADADADTGEFRDAAIDGREATDRDAGDA